MTTLREEFEALMPKSVATVLSWTNSSYSRNYRIVWSENVEEGAQLYTADQVREAMKAVAERCAVLVEREVVEELTDGDLAYNMATRHCAAIRAQTGGEG